MGQLRCDSQHTHTDLQSQKIPSPGHVLKTRMTTDNKYHYFYSEIKELGLLSVHKVAGYIMQWSGNIFILVAPTKKQPDPFTSFFCYT